MRLYRKKPVVVEAMQWTGGNREEIIDWTGTHSGTGWVTEGEIMFPLSNILGEVGNPRLHIAANNIWVELEPGEWIIKDARGFYPCKPEIFEGTYEPVVETRA
jgi:hypothetical protein